MTGVVIPLSAAQAISGKVDEATSVGGQPRRRNQPRAGHAHNHARRFPGLLVIGDESRPRAPG